MKFILDSSKRFIKNLGALLSKIVAHIFYFQICFVYYSCRGVGFAIYMVAFVFAFFSKGIDPIRIICWIYVTYLFGLILTILFAFRYKRVEDWIYREVGAEKVRKKLYNSPFLGFARLLVKGSVASGAVESGTYGVKTAGHMLHTHQAVYTIEHNADARVAEINETTNRKLAALEGKISPKEHAKLISHEWDKGNQAIAQVRAAQVQAIERIHLQGKPERGILGETASAIKETMIYEQTTKATTVAIERGASITKSFINAFHWWP